MLHIGFFINLSMFKPFVLCVLWKNNNQVFLFPLPNSLFLNKCTFIALEISTFPRDSILPNTTFNYVEKGVNIPANITQHLTTWKEGLRFLQISPAAVYSIVLQFYKKKKLYSSVDFIKFEHALYLTLAQLISQHSCIKRVLVCTYSFLCLITIVIATFFVICYRCYLMYQSNFEPLLFQF